MRELQQNRSPPAGNDNHFTIDLPADASGTGAHVVYLGPDLPSEDIAHATAVSAADILLIASTTSEGTDQEDMSKLARVPARVQIWAGGPRAAELRRVLGNRVRILDRLEDVAELLERHVA